MTRREKPGLSYNIGGTSTAWDCVYRCYAKWKADPTPDKKRQLRGAIKNLGVWAEELRLAFNREGRS